MRNTFKKIIIAVIICTALISIRTYADENDINPDIHDLENFSEQLQRENDYIPDISISGIIKNYKSSGSFGIDIKKMLKAITDYLLKEVLLNSRLMIELLLVCMLSAVIKSLQEAFTDSTISNLGYYSYFLIMIIIIIKSFTVIMQLGKSTINSMVDLTNSLMPPLMGLIAAVGGFSSAATLDPVIMIGIRIVTDIIRDLVLPMAMMAVILNIVDNLSENIKISQMAKLIDQVSKWILCFGMTVFITLITIRSSVSANIDQVALKSTKFAIDNFIPIVGKVMSDAIATVAGYSLLVKDAVSIAGLLMLVAVCVFPLIKIILVALIYKFIGAVMQPVADEKIVKCISSVGSSVTMIFACVTSVSVMFFIMITIIISTGRLVSLVG